MTPPAPHYRRIVLKLSGEALAGGGGHGLDRGVLDGFCAEIAPVVEAGTQVAVVVGGGNFFRGARAGNLAMERVSADHIGMLATVMNGLALQQALTAAGIPSSVQSAVPMPPICEPFVLERALEHLAGNRVVVFAGGTGNPFFTTDTAASLRAAEIGADLLLKATQVDGVYDRDPVRFADARRYERITYDQVLLQRLDVMDATAIALCRENRIPLRVFDINRAGCLQRIVMGDNSECTLVDGEVDA